MRIMFLCHRVPFPPNKGEKIRAFYELQEFLAAGHEVDVFSLANSDTDRSDADALSKMVASTSVAEPGIGERWLRSLGSLFSGKPLSVGQFYSSSLAEQIRRAIEERGYDLIFVYTAVMMQYLPGACTAPVILDFVDADSSKWTQYGQASHFPKSWIFRREGRLLRKFEAECAQRAQASFFVSPREIRLAELSEVPSVRYAENGVTIPETKDRHLENGPYVVFIGQMDYLPNEDAVTWFAKEIFPLVRERQPEVSFLIVGRAPSLKVKELAKLPGVKVTGEVPEVVPYLKGAAAVIAPFRISQGIHNKILEALAAGVPIVSTTAPLEAIRPEMREHVPVADDPRSFAESVIKVLSDGGYAERAQANVKRVEQLQGWRTTLRPISEAIASLCCVGPVGTND